MIPPREVDLRPADQGAQNLVPKYPHIEESKPIKTKEKPSLHYSNNKIWVEVIEQSSLHACRSLLVPTLSSRITRNALLVLPPIQHWPALFAQKECADKSRVHCYRDLDRRFLPFTRPSFLRQRWSPIKGTCSIWTVKVPYVTIKVTITSSAMLSSA